MSADANHSSSPLVSVVMPVYNSEAYLEAAIESVLAQTYQHFEFLIFNDGSTDRSREIMLSYTDERICLFDAEENQGYLVHLNQGLKLAQGKYIARMDSDDVCLPERLARQVKFMEAHPKVVACGTWVQSLRDEQLLDQYWKPPTTDAAIKSNLLFNTQLVHPSVMMRKEAIDHYQWSYQEDYYTAEDYKLWSDMAQKADLANLPEVLLHYRQHNHKVSVTKKEKQRALVARIRQENLHSHLERTLAVWEKPVYHDFAEEKAVANYFFIKRLKIWLQTFLPEVKQQISNPAVRDLLVYKLEAYWYYACRQNLNAGYWVISFYWQSRFLDFSSRKVMRWLKLNLWYLKRRISK